MQWRYEAELAREDRAFERIAQLACWVINPWLGQGKAIKTSDLLRRSGQQKSEDWWDEE